MSGFGGEIVPQVYGSHPLDNRIVSFCHSCQGAVVVRIAELSCPRCSRWLDGVGPAPFSEPSVPDTTVKSLDDELAARAEAIMREMA